MNFTVQVAINFYALHFKGKNTRSPSYKSFQGALRCTEKILSILLQQNAH